MINKILDIKDDEYFKIDALSTSFMKKFDRSPAHAFIEQESTKALDEGTAIHRYILEPKIFSEKYMVVDKIDKRTKEGKELVEKAESEGKIILTQDQINDFEAMKQSVYSRVFDFGISTISMQEVIEQGEKEVAIMFDLHGEQAKGKIDLLYSNIIFDLKTTENSDDFYFAVKKYKYDMQKYNYATGMEKITDDPHRFIFIVVEKTKPFGCILYEIEYDDEIMEKKIKNIISDYQIWKFAGADKKECYKNEIRKIYI
jgi:hypothetical protein